MGKVLVPRGIAHDQAATARTKLLVYMTKVLLLEALLELSEHNLHTHIPHAHAQTLT